jgi:hypothetical protein
MPNISEAGLVQSPGERNITFGGTRAGKSALDEWRLRQMMHERPSCMAALIDSKPRFRAETERGPLRRGRRSAAHRYESWSKGPVVPNSVVVDIHDEKPFKDIWKRPGEVAILQGGTLHDWRRMLALLNGFVEANIKGRERYIQVDECLDFTAETLGASIQKTTYFTGPRVPGESVISASTLARTGYTGSLRSYSTWPPESPCFICEPILICVTSVNKSESLTLNPLKGRTSFVSGPFNRAVLCPSHSPVECHSPHLI